MRVISRVRKLEQRFGMTIVETERFQRELEIVEDIRRRRAARLGVTPESLDDEPKAPPGLGFAETILFTRQHTPVIERAKIDTDNAP